VVWEGGRATVPLSHFFPSGAKVTWTEDASCLIELSEVVVSIRGSKWETLRGTLIGARDARAHHDLRRLFLCLCLLLVAGVSAQRTQLKPGWNRFSAQDDISLGKRAASDAEKQLPLCNAPKVELT